MRTEAPIHYPEQLRPTGVETFSLPQGQVRIPKATPIFDKWKGRESLATYGGKAIVNSSGAPAFAELAILRILEDAGWVGVWVDTYRGKFRRAYWGAEPVALPAEQAAVMKGILDHRGEGRSGTWDIFAWNSGTYLFAESKRAAKDAIRPSQVTWLSAALECGHPIDAFLVVEWRLREAA
jgi:hypothetical protein